MKESRANLSERESSLPDPEEISQTSWYALSRDDSASRLASGDDGLEDDEAKTRLERFGENRLPEEDRPGLARIFLRQFKDPLIYVLLIAGLVSLGIGNLNNALFIFAMLAINSIIGTLQEGRAERSAAALQEMIRTRARVVRDGQRKTVDAAYSRWPAAASPKRTAITTPTTWATWNFSALPR